MREREREREVGRRHVGAQLIAMHEYVGPPQEQQLLFIRFLAFYGDVRQVLFWWCAVPAKDPERSGGKKRARNL